MNGTDLAPSSRAWTIIDGEKRDDASPIDGLDYTAAETPYREKHWESADQLIELPTATDVTALGWR